MRDAIVYSGWRWETFNFPERISLALAQLGCRVLYCEAPVSVLRAKPQPLREVSQGIHALRLRCLAGRLNHISAGAQAQARVLRAQIARACGELELRDPMFLYVWMGNFFPLCELLKRDHYIVHICMDHSADASYDRLVEISDKTLALPRSAFHKFRARFGDKVETVPHCVDLRRLAKGGSNEVAGLSGIPRPRLAYTGPAKGKMNEPVLGALLRDHPEWHFISVGPEKSLSLPNAHALPWIPSEALGSFLRAIDVGFMPYDCYSEAWLHCLPTKVFEYFALGIPVVSVPLVHLWEYKDLIYFGDTAAELGAAVDAALQEPPDSPKRAARMRIARSFSLENLADMLRKSLPLEDDVSAALPLAIAL